MSIPNRDLVDARAREYRENIQLGDYHLFWACRIVEAFEEHHEAGADQVRALIAEVLADVEVNYPKSRIAQQASAASYRTPPAPEGWQPAPATKDTP
jgi:hypothetical protein